MTNDGSLVQAPDPADRIALPADFGARFMLFVDTEEEFDWSAPFDRAATAVTHMSGLARGQTWFAGAGIVPTYVIDYPIADSPAAAALLGQWASDGACAIGAHLHPWVNPPHVEEVSLANSYVGSLPEAVERAKLRALTDRIEQTTGVRPVAYRAGRYGVGRNSARILEEEGFRLDSSVRPRFDYRGQSGPDFSAMPLQPWWAGPNRSLIELPLSTAFTGALRGLGGPLHRAAEGRGRLPGALSRLGLLSRVPLTPEGVRAEEAIAAIDALLADDVPVLTLSFHSPTLEPGHTPYTRDAADLAAFYSWWDSVIGHLASRGVAPASLAQLLAAVPAGDGACQAASASAICAA